METKTSSSRRIKLRASSRARLRAPAVHLRPILHYLLLQLCARHHPAAARFLWIQGCIFYNSSSASIRLRRITAYDGGEPRAGRAWTAALSMRSEGRKAADPRTPCATATVHSPKPTVSYNLAPPQSRVADSMSTTAPVAAARRHYQPEFTLAFLAPTFRAPSLPTQVITNSFDHGSTDLE